MRFSTLAGGNKHYFHSSVSAGIVSSNPLGCFFSGTWVFSLHAFAYQCYAEYSGGFLCRSPQCISFLCAFLSSLVLWPVNSSSFFSLQTLSFISLPQTQPHFLSICCSVETLSAVRCSNQSACLICFPFLTDCCSLLPSVLCPEYKYFIYFL